ncbi:MAG: hypothetical protein ACLRYM_06005 [Thomasclavelia ramosa]
MKKIISTMICIILLSPFFVNSIQANDNMLDFIEENICTREEMNELYKNFLELGIDNNTAVKLVEKMNKGLMIDSLNPDLTDLAAVEVEENFGLRIEKRTYPDGSVRKSVYPISNLPSTGIIPRSIYGGEYRSGSGWWTWYGRIVHEQSGVITAMYKIDCSGGANESSAIIRAYDEKIITTYFKPTELDLSVKRRNVSGSTPAWAQFKFRLTREGISDGKYCVNAYMDNSRYWSEYKAL